MGGGKLANDNCITRRARPRDPPAGPPAPPPRAPPAPRPPSPPAARDPTPPPPDCPPAHAHPAPPGSRRCRSATAPPRGGARRDCRSGSRPVEVAVVREPGAGRGQQAQQHARGRPRLALETDERRARGAEPVGGGGHDGRVLTDVHGGGRRQHRRLAQELARRQAVGLAGLRVQAQGAVGEPLAGAAQTEGEDRGAQLVAEHTGAGPRVAPGPRTVPGDSQTNRSVIPVPVRRVRSSSFISRTSPSAARSRSCRCAEVISSRREILSLQNSRR